MKGVKMFICKFCGKQIDGRTDDNYNSDHSQIKCPYCGEWQAVEIKTEEEDNRRYENGY